MAVGLTIFLIGSCCKDEPQSDCTDCDLTGIPYNPTPYTVSIPADFPQLEIPATNPMTEEGIALGRRLFYDKRLSADSSMACASCHLPEFGFTDAKAFSTGVDGIMGKRSSMSLTNIGFAYHGLFWDGRAATLEEQALLPVEDPIELHENWPNVVAKLILSTEYPTWFRQAFGIKDKRDITKELATKAIAQFERTLVSGQSRYDALFIRFEDFPTEEEQLGYDLFFDFEPTVPDAECGHCHGSVLLTTNNYFNNAIDSVGSLTEFADLGRGTVTGEYLDNGRFRAPTLRNIALTAPYMHDGRFQTLEEVIEHYNSGGHVAENYDANMHPLGLSQKQKQALITLLHTMTDTSFVQNPSFQDPWK
ncbi:MAG: cytochrome C peroxidase [Saprospiraceae bacterium]|nr:cytochrome C peroxidase [Saprospiraceae bacterium]